MLKLQRTCAVATSLTNQNLLSDLIFLNSYFVRFIFRKICILITKGLVMNVFKHIIITAISIAYIDAGLGTENPPDGIPNCRIRTTGALEFGMLNTPKKGMASHASTGAVSFEDASNQEKTNYICNLNFVSCAIDSPFSASLPTDTRPYLAHKSDISTLLHPRLNLQPAFLEYLTSTDNPVENGIQTDSPLDIMIKDNQNKSFSPIFIKNSDCPPCVGEGRPGMPCEQYLQKFCNKYWCNIIVKWPRGEKRYTPTSS